MSEHVLTWRPKLPTSEAEEASLRLIQMPQGLRRPATQVRAAELLGDAARAVLLEALAGLRAQAAGGVSGAVRVGLKALDPGQRKLIEDLLGEGEVRAEVGGAARWSILESVLAGLWRVQMQTADGETLSWLEVAAVPSAVLQAAERLPRAVVSLPAALPAGAMNAPALIAELLARSASWTPGAPNHVVNFTLLPITEDDAEVLTATVGQVPLTIQSEGYGSCRIYATGLKHVWAVQYLNSMGKTILDTLEIGSIPVAACAAREDFEDSAGRLAEMLEAYAQ